MGMQFVIEMLSFKAGEDDILSTRLKNKKSGA
jgi:hypothetical protein